MFELIWNIITLPFQAVECLMSCLFIMFMIACCVGVLLVMSAV